MAAKVFVITGPSGVGKGTLIRALRKACPSLELSISATTRKPRAGEVDGVDYYFLTPEEFERRQEARDFLEFAPYSGNHYGTLRSEVDRRLEAGHSVVLEIEVQGAQQVRQSKPDSIQIFIAPPDPAVLRERLAGRGTDQPEAIDKRLETAEIELASQGDFDYLVVNDDLDRAIAELVGIVRAELADSLDCAAE
jgi:guanylate kinase